MNAIAKIRQSLKNFHESERADIPVGTILVVAFIVIPLVMLLIFYRKELVTTFKKLWADLFTSGNAGVNGQ